MQADNLEVGMVIRSEDSGWMTIREIAKGDRVASIYVGDSPSDRIGFNVPLTMHFKVQD
jgi:hypothetical protein